MPYTQFRELAGHRTHIDIPAIVANRFLLIENDIIIRDRFLSFVQNEGITQPRIRKIMYFTWAFRDQRIRRYILERVCDTNGLWRPRQLRLKSNSSFFEEFLSVKTTPKVRSNIEFFFVESGIFDNEADEVHLELDDGWLIDAIQVAAQHEPNLPRRRTMQSDPIDFLLANGWNGLANATVDQLMAIRNDSFPSLALPIDEGLDRNTRDSGIGRDWNRPKPNPWMAQSTSTLSNPVALERANAAHYRIEKLLAELARDAGYSPKFNENIDLYFKATAGHVLAEVKSCYDSNLHAQFRRGIAQLVEYEFIYRKLLGEDIGKLLVLEMRPPSRLEWLIGLATHLEITIAWLSEDGTGLESSMDLSDSLAKIVKLC
jgi:hypothetical protein